MRIENKIVVVGSGYVGMSLATMLSKKHHVTVLDIDTERVEAINQRKSTIKDDDIEEALLNQKLNIKATTNKEEAYKDAHYIIVCTPTNFDESTYFFDTSVVDLVSKEASSINQNALIIIKSTIPVGHTLKLQNTLKTKNIIFSPEFLREGSALKDNLYPSRIIVGNESEKSDEFGELLADSAFEEKNPILMSSSDAEAVKLFSNTYLAMRISFFNELDTFALAKDLSTENIIDGISLDPRIGMGYNNPSFGYGGYCLPKDTKQLLANFEELPQTLIKAIISSNKYRQKFIVDQILNLNPETVGIYRLTMKKGSDNFRTSAVMEILKMIKEKNIKTYIFEPLLNQEIFDDSIVIHDLNEFKTRSDLIVANRISADLEDIKSKVYCRDIYKRD
jgi:UDPglucose 6-dehydrogenase